MTRVSLNPPRSPIVAASDWYAKRQFGQPLAPARACGHNPRVLRTYISLERGVSRWVGLDPGLKHLAVMAVAASINCSWCMDFGYWEGVQLGLPADKIRKAPLWRHHKDSFTDLEIMVLEFAEAMTQTPPALSDELASRIVAQLQEPAFVELAAIVAVENLRSRLNSALGVTSQGFSDMCEARQP